MRLLRLKFVRVDLVYVGNVDWNMKVLISDIFCIYCVCWDKVKRMKDVTFYDFSTVLWQEYVYMNVRRTVCIHKVAKILFSELLTNLCMLQYWKYFVLSIQVNKNVLDQLFIMMLTTKHFYRFVSFVMYQF